MRLIAKALAGMVAIWIILGCFWGSAQAGLSEDLYYEIVFLHGLELGAGGRALALGGAYRALADDLSSLYWNPAGLALVRRVEVGLGISQSLARDAVQNPQDLITNQLSRTRLNEVGLVFPFPTYRGSLVFALGYHQVHSFDSFGTFLIESSDSTFQGDELESGRLGVWSLGMAMDLSEIVSAGLALRLWTGFNDYSWDTETIWAALNDSSYSLKSNLNLRGFNALTGIQLRPLPWLRLGASLETPLKLSIDENFEDHSQVRINGELSEGGFPASYSYHISRSFRAGIGAAVLLKRLTASADVALNDWSQLNYGDEPPFSGLTQDQANREVAKRLRPTADLHGGVEYWLPFLQARVQAGYGYLFSPFNDNTVIGDKQIISGGLGVLVDPSLHIQGSLAWATWERSLGGWNEDLRLAHLLVTLSYRF